MEQSRIDSLTAFEAKSQQAAGMLKLLASEVRLRILCELIKAGEMSVSALAAEIGLSQSALSQHLAKMRAEGLVASRREAQSIHYRVDNPDIARILAVLADIYCHN